MTISNDSSHAPETLSPERQLAEISRLSRENARLRQEVSQLTETNRELELACAESGAIFEAAGVGILVIDEKKRILSYNRRLKSFFFPGLDDVRVPEHTCRDLICLGDEPPQGCPCLQLAAESGAARVSSHRYHGRLYDVVFTPIPGREGAPSRYLGIYQDITDLEEGKEALRKSEARYRELFESTTDMIQSVDRRGRILFTNGTWRETLGYGEADLPGLTLFDIIDPSCRPHCDGILRRVMGGETVNRTEMTFIARDGRKILVEGNINCDLEEGETVACRGIFRDITARRRAEKALAAEKERLAVTLRSIGDGVITTDTAGSIVLINKVAERLTGWSQEEACGLPLETVFHIVSEKTGERCENPAERVLSTGSAVSFASRTALIARDGARRIIADSGAPICSSESVIIGCVLVFRDITFQQMLEVNQQRAEKLESVGLLAGGIAHDFNNMLTGIVGNISIAKMYAEHDSKVHERLTVAEKGAYRARDLTQQLLTFAKGGAPVMRTSSIQEILTDLTQFALRGSNVRCCFQVADDLWQGNMDTGQISQVIHNLLINADQAMPEGGRIDVRAENREVGVHDGLPLTHGNYLHISVSDCGTGIAPENLPRIFDPYFTTKEQGSGLGLATSYSIVRNHDGCLTVDSRPGEGTTFHVYLPASPKEGTGFPQQWGRAVAGTGRILIMDDEEMIRDIAGALLRHLGYLVAFAEHGGEATMLYRDALEKGEPFDAVIMDLTIPGGMGGKETIARLLEIDPEVRALVSSGYSTDPVLSDYRSYGFRGVVLKPYVIEELSRALQQLLEK